MDEKLYLAMLHKIGINHKKLHIIFEDNSNYKDFYDNISNKILLKYWFNERQSKIILKNRDDFSLEKLQKDIEKREVKIVTIKEDVFPDFLKEISNVPYLFYLRWKIDNSPKFSIVWARKITSYWESVIENIVSEISNYFTIVSWWAAWCDTKAHVVAMENWNKTISVIWTWIDIDYPVSNKKLYDKIALNNWAVISIFPIWEVGNPYNFPIRNEIVAWLSVWVLVIEAKQKSWTLITSNLALEMWKDLFAIPWDIFKTNSEWCNMLIKNSMAKLVSKAEDVLIEYNIWIKNKKEAKVKILFQDEIEEKIYNILILEWLTIDQLKLKLQLDIQTISFKLSMMEINKLIKKTSWWKYEVF